MPQNAEYGDAELAYSNEILRTVVGSGVHGLAVEGTDDHDEMGVFIEPPANVLGLGQPRDSYVWRTVPEGQRSRPGDTDRVLYSLRKFLSLAAKGNPTVLVPLFAPERYVLIMTDAGAELQGLREAFLSLDAIHRFLGYMHGQRERMMGRGRRSAVPNRPELIQRFGWDVKYGSHALRLAYEGWEIATEHTLTLPTAAEKRARIMAVKTGKVPREEVEEEILGIEADLFALLDAGKVDLPQHAQRDIIESWSVSAHLRHWETL